MRERKILDQINSLKDKETGKKKIELEIYPEIYRLNRGSL